MCLRMTNAEHNLHRTCWAMKEKAILKVCWSGAELDGSGDLIYKIFRSNRLGTELITQERKNLYVNSKNRLQCVYSGSCVPLKRYPILITTANT